MSRDKKIRLSDSEKEELDRVREEIFHTDEVPYGTVVGHLIDFYNDGE